MSSLDAINAAIASAATQPKKVTSDSGSVENHDLGGLVEAAKHFGAVEAARTPGLGVQCMQIVPPEATC